MSSDEAYSAFLDKANQDTGASGGGAGHPQTKTASVTARRDDVHPSLAKVDAYYTSDADEPFEPVSLVWDKDDTLDVSSFEKLLSTDADVISLTPKEFDPRRQYEGVLAAVGEAGDGQVCVFKVDFGGTRLEYYVVSITRDGGLVQGLKALAVES